MVGKRKFLRQSKGRAVWARLSEVGTCGCVAVTISWDSLVLIEGQALGSEQGRAQNVLTFFSFLLCSCRIGMFGCFQHVCFDNHVAVIFYSIWLLYHKAEDYLEACLSKLIYFCLFDLILPTLSPNCFSVHSNNPVSILLMAFLHQLILTPQDSKFRISRNAMPATCYLHSCSKSFLSFL